MIGLLTELYNVGVKMKRLKILSCEGTLKIMNFPSCLYMSRLQCVAPFGKKEKVKSFKISFAYCEIKGK